MRHDKQVSSCAPDHDLLVQPSSDLRGQPGELGPSRLHHSESAEFWPAAGPCRLRDWTTNEPRCQYRVLTTDKIPDSTTQITKWDSSASRSVVLRWRKCRKPGHVLQSVQDVRTDRLFLLRQADRGYSGEKRSSKCRQRLPTMIRGAIIDEGARACLLLIPPPTNYLSNL